MLLVRVLDPPEMDEARRWWEQAANRRACLMPPKNGGAGTMGDNRAGAENGLFEACAPVSRC